MVPDVLGSLSQRQGHTLARTAGEQDRVPLRPAHTNNANDALELMRRGDITGMSFAFEDDWQDTENGVSYERTKPRHARQGRCGCAT